MSDGAAGGTLPVLEAVAAAARRHRRAGDPEPLLAGVVETLRPTRILEIGAGDGRVAERVLALAGPRLRTYVAIDPDRGSVTRALARLTDLPAAHPGEVDVGYYHAALRACASIPGAPHYTRIAAIVAALKEDGFDLVLLRPHPDGDALYLELVQAVALLRGRGCLICAPLDAATEASAAIVRLVREGGGRALRWQPDEDAPAAALVGARLPRRNHEETVALRDELLAADASLQAAHARADHARVCARLRHWLAGRLVWCTEELLLPLGALPPPLSPRDVVEHCARGEGGVRSLGAAVTLAMLYRAFGYPATVYPHGVPGLYTHVMTLVGLPDGRLVLQDAFFDAEPRLDGRAATWPEMVALAGRAEIERVTFDSELAAMRPHLYAGTSLARAEEDGYLTRAERGALAAEMRGCAALAGEPRAPLAQAWTCSLAAYARMPAHARALAEVERRIGTANPLALLAHPTGTLPLTGDPSADGVIVRVLEPRR